MSTQDGVRGAVRLSFQLGPWRSPRSRGWREAYDSLVASLCNAGGPVYGVLEAGLAGGRTGAPSWRRQFAANAAEVVRRYGDRIHAFEILPGPNRPAMDGSPQLSEQVFGGVLAETYGCVKEPAGGRDVELVAGAVAQYDDAAGYLARAIEAGTKAAAWISVPGLTHHDLPMDAVAAWPELPADPGSIPPGHLDRQIDRLLHALSPFDAAGVLPVYISGLTRRAGTRGDFEGGEIEAALGKLSLSRPRVRIAAREAAAAGPSYTPVDAQAAPVFFIFAISGGAPRAALARAAATAPLDGFDFPVGSREAVDPRRAGYAMTTALADPDYFVTYKSWHPGEDWAAYGDCDASLHEPVYAIADGIVACRNYFTPSWGNIIVVRHTLRSGATVWSQYAHLDTCLVNENAAVRRGQQIGTIGKGEQNRWCAHLHFEIRNIDLKADEWFPLVSSKRLVLANYLSPAEFIAGHRPAVFADRRGTIVDNEPRQQDTGAFTRTEAAGHWTRSYFGWNDTADVTYASTVETDWGEWRPNLAAAGRYEVQVWIPSRHATTKNAVYTVQHAGGLTARAVDQSAWNDQWISLGTYDFGADGALVRLTDKTGEPDSAKLEVCFDAVRWLQG